MCGIVGITKKQGVGAPNTSILVDGLRRLEYRGYDSAGICLSGAAALSLYRAVGKVAELEKKIPEEAFDSKYLAGVAHTRWATHGGVSEENAHPHLSMDGSIAVVHNGIIDNADELRSKLIKLGYIFKSATDTEVIAHLIQHYRDKSRRGWPQTSIKNILNKLKGTYGLAILLRDCPSQIIVARMGSPLVVGLADNYSIVASDASVVAKHTNRVVYLEDGDIFLLSPDGIVPFSSATPIVQEITQEELLVDKEHFDSYMLKEIFEQPDAISRCFGGRVRQNTCSLGGFNIEEVKLSEITSVNIIGCGTSYHAGLLGAHLIEKYAGIPCRVHIASEFANRRIIPDRAGIYLAISQSGETYDTLECVRELKGKSCNVYGIVNTVGSTIARLCGKGVYIHAGPEVAVASTKAFTSQFAALSMFAIMLGRAKELDAPTGLRLCIALAEMPPIMRELLNKASLAEQLQSIAATLAESPYVLFLGRGMSYPVAMEGALKLREIAYVPCEAYAGGEMKHGPIAMIGNRTPVICMVPEDESFHRMIGNIREVQARGARVIALSSSDNVPCDTLIKLPKVDMDFTPFIYTLILQLLSYYAAKYKGYDIDRPKNLAKSVTVG